MGKLSNVYKVVIGTNECKTYFRNLVSGRPLDSSSSEQGLTAGFFPRNLTYSQYLKFTDFDFHIFKTYEPDDG